MKDEKKPAIFNLVDRVKNEANKSIETAQSDLAQGPIPYADRETAQQIIGMRATHEADRKFSSALTKSQLECDEIDARYNRSLAALAKLEDELASTDRYIKNDPNKPQNIGGG